MESSSTLAVEAEVLRERLGDHQLEALFDEVPDGKVVSGEISGGEALVCAVEEGEVTPISYSNCNLLPLFRGRVNTGRIVGTCMKEYNGAFGGGLDGGEHAFKVETLGLCAEVGVCLDGQVDIGEDLVVVGPCRRREVDSGRWLGNELGEEETT